MMLPKLSESQSPADFNELLEQARKASDLLKALSHESRLLILCLLAEGERSVSELEDIMRMPQATVSQQLARLRLDGLVNTRRDGRAIYYSIASREVASVIGALYDLFCAPVRSPGQRGDRAASVTGVE
ncbi:transcriptional regulator [Mesorhizobium tianshanense]|uniref:DNA-binding transcriptional ArsR family regulator n=1 Tax=Mesorhizobium tianshanense TaxID=39844 RepID=A0A562PD30_9HYPH|nr:metalloregulator ArsR/SmtB family transcription factor [Mesorhizobium tianshanense]TWI41886.1 DNA-binding transcriptional ArsR family regulator [Mesorhizobium tianshanense]GLS34789.1 transcriptional regulator [Mesorhizobium tianshanense]